MVDKIHFKKAKYPYFEYWCPYCKKELTYIWIGNRFLGMCLDKWLYCSKCKICYKLGVTGFREYELDLKKISQSHRKVKAC